MDLRPHIEKFSRRFAEVEAALSDPKAFDNPQRAQELSKEYARLKGAGRGGPGLSEAVADLAENRALLQDRTGRFRTGADGEGGNRPAGSGGEAARAGSSARAPAARPDGFAQHDHRNSRRRRRPGVRAVRRRPLPDVHPLRRRRAAGRSRTWIPARPTSAASRKSFSKSPARTSTSGSSTRAACTASSACRRPRRRAASTPAPAPWPCCRRPRKWTSRSSPRISRSTSAAPPARAARA